MEEEDIDDENFVEPEVEESPMAAKVVAATLQVSGFILGFYFLLHPPPVEIAWLFYIIYPVLTIVAYRYFKGGLLLMSSKSDKRFGVGMAFVFPELFLFMGVCSKYKTFGPLHLLIPGFLAGLVLFAAIVYKNDAFRLSYTTLGKIGLAFLLVMTLTLGYGFAALYNFSGQSEAPVSCKAVISAKHISTSSGRMHTYFYYHFALKPWQFTSEGNDVLVGKSTYYALGQGDTVQITVYRGRLNSCWYEIPFYPSAEVKRLMGF